MNLSNTLIDDFAKLIKGDEKKIDESTESASVVISNGKTYVKLDGSTLLTPVETVTDVKNGDRVIVRIKNHTATITGSTSAPSARKETVDVLDGNIKVAEAEIGKLTADVGDFKNLTTDKFTATDATIKNLTADVGSFKNLTTDKFTATDASIQKLEVDKLSATDADIKYAKIDFANINTAAVEKLFADSGIIKNLVVSGGHITGELVGVTIKGDLIEAGTVKADKLVVKGSDGIYYKLNMTAEKVEALQTDQNSLDGSVITAKSITATKVMVDDLVAFDATIAGLNLTNGSIFSGVKSSVDNTTRGFYLDKEGQMALGDGSNFLKYFKDQNGIWRLAISAGSIKLSASNKDLETTLGETVTSSVEEFYQSNSNTSLVGGAWQKTQPTWKDGTYIWRRTLVTHGNGTTEYTPSENGVCITGNTGSQGSKGDKGDDAIFLQILSSNGNVFKNSNLATSLTVTIIIGNTMITCAREMHDIFGPAATIEWEQKLFGENIFTRIDPSDPRLSDEGFIMTLTPIDVMSQTTFNCKLNY